VVPALPGGPAGHRRRPGAIPERHHVKVGDGKGKPLGRSFQVKLWPTLVFLKDGKEMARAVRPASEDEVRNGLEAIAS